MKILVISPNPPNNFHRIRLTHIVKALKNDHEIDIVCQSTPNDRCFKKTYKAKIFNKDLWKCYKDVAVNIFNPIPLEASFCIDNDLKIHIRKIQKDYDIIIVKRLRTMVLMPEKVGTPVIIDSTDAMSMYYKKALSSVPVWKKPLFLEEYIKYRNYEKKISKNFKNWVVCSEEDKKYLNNILMPNAKINVVPNVVDTSYYQSSKLPDKNTILFSGLMDKHVNGSAIYYFLEEIFPNILQNIPDVKLYIVGPKPSKSLLNKTSRNIIVTGKVKDIRKYIEKASLVVVPTIVGSGTRNKILQAWSQSRAIVSTSIGASGLEFIKDKNILIEDDPKLFAKHVNSILTNKKISKVLGQEGRKWVKKHYSVNIMRKKYNQVINNLVNNDLKKKQKDNTSSDN
ncbi:glycosyltransferase [Candidatus Woesebacteria bacterium]|nr:glycosyltransferase [Candidatus Woesebacteria bacterium]